MLTIFACPKPFTDPHIAIIQRNAITSWTLLRPRPEIILFGDEAGTSEICGALDIFHIPVVQTNEFGTPILSDIFDKAQKIASGDVLCYVNSDIIFTQHFMHAVERVSRWRDRWLMIGIRVGLRITKPLNFEDPDWERRLVVVAKKFGQKFWYTGADYFVFPRGLFENIPPFVIGRSGWDNWVVRDALEHGVPVVDATPIVLAIHQDHDRPNRSGWELESQRNLQLLGDSSWWARVEVTHRLTRRGVRKCPKWHTRLHRRRFLIYKRVLSRIRPVLHLLGLRRRWEEAERLLNPGGNGPST
jgi:hypothetical protein